MNFFFILLPYFQIQHIICCLTHLFFMISLCEKRENLIHYFMSISTAQKQVQNIQNKLSKQVFFKPVSLYLKISKNSTFMHFNHLRHYIQQKIPHAKPQAIRIYCKKYSLDKKIPFQQFLSTLIPYTPHIIRNLIEKISYQSQKSLDVQLEKIYKKLLKVQIQNIYACWDWQQVEQFIQDDIAMCGKLFDVKLTQQQAIIKIRRWLELWVDMNQHEILNVMRWFQGGSKQQIKAIYNNYSKRHSKIHTKSEFKQIVNKPKRIRSLKTIINNYSNNSKSKQYCLQLFLKYIRVIIHSQHKIQKCRILLRYYKKQVHQILQDIVSKIQPKTKMDRIIDFIQKKNNSRNNFIFKDILDMKIANQLIFCIFTVQGPKTKKKILSIAQITNLVSKILQTFCQTKVTLINLSKQLDKKSRLVFECLDEKKTGKINEFQMHKILNQAMLKHNERDLVILMNHFGDGSQITFQTFEKIFKLQLKSVVVHHKNMKND